MLDRLPVRLVWSIVHHIQYAAASGRPTLQAAAVDQLRPRSFTDANGSTISFGGTILSWTNQQVEQVQGRPMTNVEEDYRRRLEQSFEQDTPAAPAFTYDDDDNDGFEYREILWDTAWDRLKYMAADTVVPQASDLGQPDEALELEDKVILGPLSLYRSYPDTARA